MSTVEDTSHWLAARSTAWRLSSDSTFEVTVKPRSGPIHIAGNLRFLDGTVHTDSSGEVHIAATVDAGSLDIHEGHRYPRQRFPIAESKLSVRLRSTRAAEPEAGRLRVTGELIAGTTTVPLDLLVCGTSSDGSLELVATTTVNHRRLGMVWLPGSPVKAPTALAIRARLIPDTDPRGAAKPDLGRLAKATNSRYQLMARRSRPATNRTTRASPRHG